MSFCGRVAARYDRAMWPLERLLLGSLRRQASIPLTGRVLELGVGAGPNLPYYSPGARVLACDLSPEILSGALRRPRSAEILIVQADAAALPVQDSRVDCVAASLVFCSLENPVGALREVRCALQPGGCLVLLEHVRGLNPFTRTLTDLLAPPWLRLTRSCHLNHDTAQTVAGAGFQVATTSHLAGLAQVILARKTE